MLTVAGGVILGLLGFSALGAILGSPAGRALLGALFMIGVLVAVVLAAVWSS